VGIVTGFVCSRSAAKDSGALNHDIHVEVSPGQITRVTLSKATDLFAVNDQIFVVEVDRAVKPAMNRVVFQQHCQGLVVRKVTVRTS